MHGLEGIEDQSCPDRWVEFLGPMARVPPTRPCRLAHLALEIKLGGQAHPALESYIWFQAHHALDNIPGRFLGVLSSHLGT